MKTKIGNYQVSNLIISFSLFILGFFFLFIRNKLSVGVGTQEQMIDGVVHTVIPFNIGFSFPQLLGSIVVLFFQSGFLFGSNEKEVSKASLPVIGMLLFSIICPAGVVSSSKTWLMLSIRESGYEQFAYYGLDTMDLYINIFLLILLCMVIIVVMLHHKTYFWFNIVTMLLGFVILVYKAFTNIWYVVLSILTIVTSYFIMGKYLCHSEKSNEQ